MAWTPEDEEDLRGADLFRALRADAVQAALNEIEADTGLPRERVIAEAVVFAGRDRRAFLAHLRGRPSRVRGSEPERRGRRFLSENAAQILVAGMFLLGAALAAIQMLLR
ncbi:hypothetical protein [Dichotomicrobium thermohalophilum]|uniref:Uncharacterized protein n=1 Tax=Dichotomicrobium thermohalophilum TaxID=933063 RepID=A0A397PDY6_9HYPH|nr:hypothetical protein [Dichotomicrobium thermohalophilum]RIA47232.1 hypothetical protein BXY53_2614 [Dichotomicrobium thermohalophilum]